MIQSNFTENLPYRIFTLAVMAAFYGIYFSKMISQKKKGITTNQIGTRKEKKLHTVETLMAAATYGIVPVQLLSVCMNCSALPDNARFTGLLTGILGDIIFLCAVLDMKDSWRAGIPESDKTLLVTNGIYRFSRNPAFLGFDMMYIGILLMYFNLLNAAFTAFAVVMLHLQILQEEKFMLASFGEAYADYKNQVFRYLGRKI